MLAASVSVTGQLAQPTISSEAAILMDADTGKVLYEKRCRQRRPHASTTKMMTAIIALENGNLDDTVKISNKASRTPYSSLNLKAGETFTLRDLMYALLVRSGNDASVAVAEHIAGSEQAFLNMMNAKAREIGAKDTNFMNPHGLHHANHYSTAYDLAVIARYAIRVPEFNNIVQTKTTYIPRANADPLFLRNTARFLWRFDGADGIKTGYTSRAGRCFVGSATRDNWRLIAVSLNSKDAAADVATILDFGFNGFQQISFAKANQVATTIPVSGGVEPEVDLLASDDIGLVHRRTSTAQTRIDIDYDKAVAPITEGDKLGTLTGYVNGEKIGTVDLYAAKSVDRSLLAALWIWTKSALVVSAIFLAGFVSYGTAVAKTARRRRYSLAARV